MDIFLQLLTDWGYFGMFLSAFLAGTILPFSSEAVLLACVGLGLDPIWSTIATTAGNVLGGLTCYWIGHLGKMEWIEKYLHVKRESVEKAQHWMERKGAWVGGVLCVVPVIGDAISVALGFMRANWLICLISITIGKLVRYAILVYTVTLF